MGHWSLIILGVTSANIALSNGLTCVRILHQSAGMFRKINAFDFREESCLASDACKRIDYSVLHGPDVPIQYKMPGGETKTFKITTRPSSEVYPGFKTKMVDHNEMMKQTFDTTYLDAQKNGSKSIRMARIGLDRNSATPTLKVKAGAIISRVTDTNEALDLDMTKVQGAVDGINAFASDSSFDERGHAIIIASDVTGEPLMPSEIDMATIYLSEIMQAQGIQITPANIRDYAGTVSIFKIVPNPNNPADPLVLHFDPAQQ